MHQYKNRDLVRAESPTKLTKINHFRGRPPLPSSVLIQIQVSMKELHIDHIKTFKYVPLFN
jgi:hypothetical protein